MIDTRVASEDAIELYRHDWAAALKWQVAFLEKRLKDYGWIKLTATNWETQREGFWIFRKGDPDYFITFRQFLEKNPRSEYLITFEDDQKYIVRTRKGYRFTMKLLPWTFNHIASRFDKRRLRDCIVLPNLTTARAATPVMDCERRSPDGATAWQVLAHFNQQGWGTYATTTVKTGRGRVMYRIASELAAQGATADEIETVIRASPAFKSKVSDQGTRWGEQEIQRLRGLAR